MMNDLYSLSDLFQKRLFRIPDYQRGYAWQLDQLRDFWDDLNNLETNRYHYTGLLSLKPLDPEDERTWRDNLWMKEKGYKIYHVVDGQQRLMTFVILLYDLVCFVRSLPENSGKQDKDILLGVETLEAVTQQYICQRRPPNGIITTYLFGYETDDPSDRYLRYRIFDEPNAVEIEETYYTKNLKDARDFFSSNIRALYKEEGMDGLERLYKKLTQKMMFNLHEIDEDYDVYVAFETMNNRGKPLSNLELLKNRLIYLTTVYGDDKLDDADKNRIRDDIREAWREVYHQLGRNKSRVLRDDDFLRDHWIIYFSYSRKKGNDCSDFLLKEKFTAKNIYSKRSVVDIIEPKEMYDKADSDSDDYTEMQMDDTIEELEPNEILNYVHSLKNMAKYWYYIWFPYDCPDLSETNKLWIDRLNRLGIGYFRPLVAAALCKFSSQSELRALLSAIERFIFICFRMGRSRSDYQSTMYYSAARDLYKGEKTVQEITESLKTATDDNVQYAISGFTSYIKKNLESDKREGYYAWRSALRYFLFEYEYRLWESTGVKKMSWDQISRTENDKISIEHILPQAPSDDYWKHQFSKYISSHEEITRLTGTIGNLILLAQRINSSLQNDSFPEKKNPSREGRRGYSNGSNSETEVAENEDWNAGCIYKRSKKLLEFMRTRWDIPMTDDQIEELTFVGFVKEDDPNGNVGAEKTDSLNLS